jgi:myo-inositol-hexaphosphate 3-phosphohydrolase
MLPAGQKAGYLRVYNLQGQQLLEHSLQGRLSEVDIPLSSGVYLFAVQPVSNGAPFWQKIIIQ